MANEGGRDAAQRAGVSVPVQLLWVGAALVASVVLAFALTGDGLIATAFAGGLAVLALAGFAGVRTRPRKEDGDTSREIDWSITLAALDTAGLAIAVTDRANRLACATDAYRSVFGTAAPPRVVVQEPALDRLTYLARTAWREGSGEEASLEAGGRRWVVRADRAGAGEAFLVWHFAAQGNERADVALGALLSGPFGQMLSEANIAAALVGPDEIVRETNTAFAAAASGDGDEPRVPAGRPLDDLVACDDAGGWRFTRQPADRMPLAGMDIAFADSASLEQAGEHPPRLRLLFDPGLVRRPGTAASPSLTAPLEALAGQLPLGLAAIGRDGRFLFANPAFRRAAGIGTQGPEARLPVYPSDLVTRGDKAGFADAVRRYAYGAAQSGDLTFRFAAAPDEPVSVGLIGMRGLGEVALLLTIADTTEENRLKRQVAQATKMQAVGQLAGGVAHDFNNVLTAIIGTCDLMLDRHQPGDADHRDIEEIKRNSDRAASLTRQLLAFSRQQTLKPEVIALPDVLAGMADLLERLLGARIALQVNSEPKLGPVRADPRQLEQVVMNLAVNARDAIRERGGEQASGELTFTLRPMDAAAIRKLGNEVIPPGDYALIELADTGGGIDRRVLPKIFEPFFTTKELGKGTGLGLSTVYGIVKQSGGFIFAENVIGPDGATSGARFRVFLPVHAASPEELRQLQAKAERSPPAMPEADKPGGVRILLVEDEDMVRKVAERALVRAGHQVVTARDGEEGLEKFRSDAPFDLLLTDVVMPGIDGPAMARALRGSAPDLPVLFMSGYAEGQLREGIDLAAAHFIAKPFSVREITDKVGAIMKESAAG